MTRSLQIILLFAILIQSEDWRLDRDQDNIKVYTRKIKGIPIRQFSVESHTSASLEEIEKLMRQMDKYASWMPDVSECESLERENDNSYIYHMIISAPFPVSDRDLVARMTISYPEPDVLHIAYENLPDHIPETKKYVRIPYFNGYWKFTREGDSTRIRNQFISDPGGSVPASLINSFIYKNPFNTVKNLKDQVE